MHALSPYICVYEYAAAQSSAYMRTWAVSHTHTQKTDPCVWIARSTAGRERLSDREEEIEIYHPRHNNVRGEDMSSIWSL
jgi:hypothetical protein